MSSTILSTKQLTFPQSQRIINSGLGLVSYNAIQIDFLKMQWSGQPQHLIFTSQNGVASFLESSSSKLHEQVKAYCVGEKTKALLLENGIDVCATANNSQELGMLLVKTYSDTEFLLLSGNLRREDLPRLLKENNVRYKEVTVYNTTLTPARYERQFEGVLFFSPSAVQSHCSSNTLENSTAFCIGPTTAKEAQKHTDKVIIANKPTIENVLVQAIKQLA